MDLHRASSIDAIQASLDDATLKAPRTGRIQYRIAQEGEIVGSGGRILSLVDLGDVYMTVFLPTSQVGRVISRFSMAASASSCLPWDMSTAP